MYGTRRDPCRTASVRRGSRRLRTARVVRAARITRAAAAQEGHRPRLQAPAVLGTAVGVGVVADPHLVRCLLDEAERLLARTSVTVELECRRAGQEQALRCGRHELGEVRQAVRLTECAV